MITDFHTHAFPDAIAARAMAALLAETDKVHAHLDGRVASLLRSMDAAGIDRAVVCSIATKPDQFEKILAWSQQIASARIVPFPSVHPRDPLGVDRVRQLAAAGFNGIKLHPYYQDFDLADPTLEPFFAAVEQAGLVVLCHTGFDIAFPRVRRADPQRVVRLLDRFPRLRFIATHLGGWDDWDEVERLLVSRPIYMDMSYTFGDLPTDRVRRILLAHPPEYLLFGTDSPWQDQAETLRQLRALDLGREREAALLGDVSARLLGG